MSSEPDNLVLEMLRGLRGDIKKLEDSLRREFKSDMHSLRADIASDILELRRDMEKSTKETREQIVGLRRAVVEYHSTVVGHGLLISELEARVRRVELHLDLPWPAPH